MSDFNRSRKFSWGETRGFVMVFKIGRNIDAFLMRNERAADFKKIRQWRFPDGPCLSNKKMSGANRRQSPNKKKPIFLLCMHKIFFQSGLKFFGSNFLSFKIFTNKTFRPTILFPIIFVLEFFLRILGFEFFFYNF